MSTQPGIARLRTRWSAIGAAVAVSLGAGGIGLANASLDSGDKPVTVTVDAERILDTRIDLGLPGRFADATPRDLQVTGEVDVAPSGQEAVVPDGATAVLVNVTVVFPSDAGFLALRSGDATGEPSTSTVNFFPGTIEPNAATVELSSDGKIQIWVETSSDTGNAHVLIDVVGYTIDHTHDDRYYTEDEIDTALDDKADAADVYTKTEADAAHNLKADAADVYTQAEVDAAIAGLEFDAFDRTIIVGGSGTPNENGAALLVALGAASAESPTAADPWQVQLQPGTFDTGGADVSVPSHVDLVGAGWGSSIIVCTACTNGVVALSSTTIAHLAINGADPAITATGALDVAIHMVKTDGGDVFIAGSGADLDQVDLRGRLFVLGGSGVTITDSSLFADDALETALEVTDSTVEGDNLTIDSILHNAINLYGGTANLSLSDSVVAGRDPIRSAFKIHTNAFARLDDVRVIGVDHDGFDINGAELLAKGLRVDANGKAIKLTNGARAEVHDAALVGQSGTDFAVDAAGSSTVIIDDSEILSVQGGGIKLIGGGLELRGSTIDSASGFDAVLTGSSASTEIRDSRLRTDGLASGLDVTGGGHVSQDNLFQGGDPAVAVRGDAFLRIDGGRIESFATGVDGLVLDDLSDTTFPFAEVHNGTIGASDDAIRFLGDNGTVLGYGAIILGPDSAADGIVQGPLGAGATFNGGFIDAGGVNSNVSSTCTGVATPTTFVAGPATCPAPPPP